jgi:hypothetical protein
MPLLGADESWPGVDQHRRSRGDRHCYPMLGRYTDEIDVWINEIEAFEAQALLAWERRQDLLAR